jgi:aminoglycoside phosphotransferase (APT) family kinase protein
VVTRDLGDVRRAFVEWLAGHLTAQGIDASELDVELTSFAAGGYSNEIFFVDATYVETGEPHASRLVLRLPPDGPSLFPTYDLAMQVAVQVAVGAQGVPVPSPVTLEPDERWLGTPFLVMPLIDGHNTGELPVADPWLGTAEPELQRTLQEGFLDTLARIHRTPWEGQPVADHLRGAGASVHDEVRWWEDLADWTFDGTPPPALVSAFAWCREHVPAHEPPASVLWGDVRLGNVIFDDGFAPVAVLDWEMASIGAPEHDLAWYIALEGMTEHFFGQRVRGFLTRDEIVARHQQALGRPLVDFEWFEIFAMCRSTALSMRTDRLASFRLGKPPRSTEGHAVLDYTLARIASIG